MSPLAARNMVGREVARGGLPVAVACSLCPSVEHIDYHHHDYSRPLDVTPVCRSCHRLIHSGAIADPVTGKIWQTEIPPSAPPTALGTYLRGLRMAVGLSVVEVAAIACVSEAAVGHWERGRRVPDRQGYLALLDAYRCPADRRAEAYALYFDAPPTLAPVGGVS